jgi:phosphotransferase system HPr-like phosphotransfer protein
MRLIGSIRPTATTELVAEGNDRGSAYDALAALVPAGQELIQAHVSMKAGVTTARGVIRPNRTESIEADGADYVSANAALEALVPDGYVLLGRVQA